MMMFLFILKHLNKKSRWRRGLSNWHGRGEKFQIFELKVSISNISSGVTLMISHAKDDNGRMHVVRRCADQRRATAL
jgi:hypothetical protein